ncbi:hypothetical protein GN958_ATG10870 [Phytophthora infestans]|uniref:Monopolin complex subunit Csm1/Pcs1 C-terminal domain-containing protein n=1 Tax=Phytophthora infestans TaxID=4787 RepID=A0A8S9UHJ1_PHYIN|nr:hypothetical protein GN958_ATG10870 [Phytophthora infestans]
MPPAKKAGEKKRSRPKKAETSVTKKKKQCRRKNSWDYEDDDGDVEFADAGDDDSELEDKAPKPKKKRALPRKAPVKKDEKVLAVQNKKNNSTNETQDEDQEDERDRALLEQKHRSRKQQYEHDSEKLLQEVRDLAWQEKKTQEKLIEKLKRDITTLSKQDEEQRKKRKKEVDRLVAEKMREYDAKQRSREDADAEKRALREHIKELESQFASFKRCTGPDDAVTVNAAAASAATAIQNGEAMLQLNQANKLLELYRLVTSTDIRLIQAGEDDDEADDCTEVVCTTTDSATGNQFEFELAVPAIVSSEIEYLPSETPPTGIKVPSYLREELSFSRSEMTKFIRSVLDVVIRKKKV